MDGALASQHMSDELVSNPAEGTQKERLPSILLRVAKEQLRRSAKSALLESVAARYITLEKQEGLSTEERLEYVMTLHYEQCVNEGIDFRSLVERVMAKQPSGTRSKSGPCAVRRSSWIPESIGLLATGELGSRPEPYRAEGYTVPATGDAVPGTVTGSCLITDHAHGAWHVTTHSATGQMTDIFSDVVLEHIFSFSNPPNIGEHQPIDCVTSEQKQTHFPDMRSTTEIGAAGPRKQVTSTLCSPTGRADPAEDFDDADLLGLMDMLEPDAAAHRLEGRCKKLAVYGRCYAGSTIQAHGMMSSDDTEENHKLGQCTSTQMPTQWNPNSCSPPTTPAAGGGQEFLAVTPGRKMCSNKSQQHGEDQEMSDELGGVSDCCNDSLAAERRVVTREMLELVYHLPINGAAERLGMGVTVLKKYCRQFNVGRWPFRKLSSIDKLIDTIKHESKDSPEKAATAFSLLHELTLCRQEIYRNPMHDIPGSIKRLRQANFKNVYKHRHRRNEGEEEAD